MENNVKKLDKNNTKKININMNNKDLITRVKQFYNEKIKKAHIILFIISVLIFTVAFASNMYALKNGGINISQNATPSSFASDVKNNFLLSLIIIIAGITPYVPISFLGIAESAILVGDMTIRSYYGISFLVTLYLGGFIQLIGVSLCVAVGAYYCKLSTKKNKYYHHSDFGMDDIKMQLYEIRKDNKKLEEITKKKEEKAKQIESYNIKIPYLNMIVLGVVAFIIEFIGVVITKI